MNLIKIYVSNAQSNERCNEIVLKHFQTPQSENTNTAANVE